MRAPGLAAKRKAGATPKEHFPLNWANFAMAILFALKNSALIEYTRLVLENGLRVLIHIDNSTPMAAVNVLYNVGSRDESEDKTGFAHLFEHLMFSGSVNIPDFDAPIQNAGGENNAFTNNDMTNFYELVPAENLETALWLESDRMLGLRFDEKALEVQRKVVVEEFKETTLNQPYGDVWHHLAEMAYKVHPYKWPTIGKEPRHIEEATMDDVRQFYKSWYHPNNAILSIAGNLDLEKTVALVHRWFGDIPAANIPSRAIPEEPVQVAKMERIQSAPVPVNALYLAFHMVARNHPDFYVADLLSDILANGPSSRLFRRLLKERQLFTQIDAFVTASFDPGLLIIEGRPAPGIGFEEAKQAIWEELYLLQQHLVSERELQKYKNKVESTLAFSEGSVLNKAMNLAQFEALGDASLINRESSLYQAVTVEDIQRLAKAIFTVDNCSEMLYEANGEAVLPGSDDDEDDEDEV